MRGNHDNGMCFQTMRLIAVAVAMVFVLCVTAGTIGALAKADDGSYIFAKALCNGANGGLWCDMF